MSFFNYFIVWILIGKIHHCDAFSFTLKTPNYLSQQASHEIVEYVSYIKNYCPKCITTLLLKQFTWLSNVTIKRTQHEHYLITLFTKQPLYTFNNTHYVTTCGKFFPLSLLQEKFYTSLASLTYAPENYCEIDTGDQMALLPATLFATYTIIWKNAHYIIINHKDNKFFPIITSYERKITPAIAEYCDSIHKKFVQPCTNKKKKKYAFDIRFDKQIVLRPQEDIKYEKSFSS